MRSRKALVRVAPALAALALAVFCAAPVLAGTEYVVTDLGTPGVTNGASLYGDYSYGLAINNAGQAVGDTIDFSTNSNGALLGWESNGITTTVLNTGGYAGSFADGINGGGGIVGAVTTATSTDVAAYWTSASATPTLITPSLPSGASSYATGINVHGMIVGDYTSASGADYAFSFNSNTDTLTHLTTQALLNSQNAGWVLQTAAGINASGQIVGLGTLNGVAHAYLYSGGVVTDLGAIGGSTYPGIANMLQGYGALAINDNGVVAGGIAGASYYPQVAVWTNPLTNQTPQNLGSLSGGQTFSNAFGINSQGVIVGDSSWVAVPYNGDNPFYGDCFVSTGGVLTDLNTVLVPADAGYWLDDAYGINDHGVIVGDGYAPPGAYTGNYDAVLLTPTPEPISMIFFATGLVAVGGFVARRRMLRTA